MAPVGRWQKGKDLLWYAKDAQARTDLPQHYKTPSSASSLDAQKERELLKQQEALMMHSFLASEVPPLLGTNFPPLATTGSVSTCDDANHLEKSSMHETSKPEERAMASRQAFASPRSIAADHAWKGRRMHDDEGRGNSELRRGDDGHRSSRHSSKSAAVRHGRAVPPRRLEDEHRRVMPYSSRRDHHHHHRIERTNDRPGNICSSRSGREDSPSHRSLSGRHHHHHHHDR